MAKKKESLTLDEVKRCVKLHKSFHNTPRVNIEDLAKELGIKKLDLWEFILENKLYFIIQYIKEPQSNTIKWRFVKKVLNDPMNEEEYKEMIETSNYIEYR